MTAHNCAKAARRRLSFPATEATGAITTFRYFYIIFVYFYQYLSILLTIIQIDTLPIPERILCDIIAHQTQLG